MADTQMTYNMRFNADTSAAKKQIEDLSKSLDKLISPNQKGYELPLTKELVEAQSKVIELKTHLESAMNTNTGKLDLSKFNDSLKKSNTSLKDYQKILLKLGSDGQSSFLKLSQAISQAEMPLKRTSTLMKDFANTMKNTVQWQLSSSMMHGFMSVISGAWNYAKDLNESLNDIRIVTGYNIDQMSAFADQANRAAKALSTTTTEYTDASLIYYQQGLTDEEVQSRTDTTIKLANVSKQSVTESADQMTTIWNNYADGAENLEYYADVLVKLGAATASSSEEIATGISKFAATGKTVGLSYEYATAALATVTATTRESADTVGTAFKTLFARIQDLEQGKTLDDGTTLGQYAEALDKVGVNIKTATGEVKDMDQILDEVGEKWGTLSKDAQIALAENVAGVRQYTQFMALMNEWDFFKENVQTAKESTGALEEQQEIYSEGWEAASERLTASLQNIYQNLLDDSFFIDIIDDLAVLTNGIGDFIETLGGLEGVALTLTPILLNAFGSELSANIDNIIFKFSKTKDEMNEIKKQNASGTQEFLNASKSDISNYAVTSALTSNANYLKKVQEYSGLISETDQKQLQIQSEIIRLQSESLINQSEFLEQEEEKVALKQAEFDLEVTSSSSTELPVYNSKNILAPKTTKNYGVDDLDTIYEKVKELETIKTKIEGALSSAGNNQVDGLKKKLQETTKILSEYQAALVKLENGKAFKGIQQQIKDFDELSKKVGISKQIISELNLTMEKLKNQGSESVSSQEITQIQQKIEAYKELYSQETEEYNLLSEISVALQQGDIGQAIIKYQEFSTAVANSNNSLNKLESQLKNIAQGLRSSGEDGEKAAAAIEALLPSLRELGEREGELSAKTAENNAAWQAQINALNQLNIKTLTTGESIVAFGRVCSQLASTLNMIRSSVTSIFSQDTSAMEKVVAVFMLLGQVTFVFNKQSKETIINLLLTAENVYRASKGQSQLTVETLKSALAQKSLIGSLRALSTEMNLSLGVIGLIILAITTVISVLTALSELEDRAIEKAEAAAEKAKEVADAKEEEAASNQELIDTYNTALKAYEENEESKEDLVKAAEAVTDAYEIEGAAVAELTGNYEGLTAAIQEARRAELEDNKKDYKNAKYTAENELKAKWEKIDVGDNGNITTSGTDATTVGHNASKQEWDEAKQLYQSIFEDGDFELLDGSYGLNGSLELNIDEINAENIVQAYEEIQAFREAVLATDNDLLRESTQMTTLTEWADQLESAYNDYIKYQDLIQETNVELAASEVFIGEGSEQKGLYDLETISEYQQYKEALIKTVAEEQGITEEDAEAYADLTAAVEAYLGTISGVADLQKNDKGISELADKYNIDEGTLQNYFASLTPEEQELFWSIDFDRAKDTAAFDLEIDRLQAKANQTTLEVAVETTSNAKESFSTDMSTDELLDWKDSSGLNWGKQIEGTKVQVIKFSEFLKMSAAEQEAYLAQLNENTQAYLEEEKANEKAALEEELSSLRSAYSSFLKSGAQGRTLSEEDAQTAAKIKQEIEEVLGQLDALDDSDNEVEVDIIINAKEAQEQLDNFLSQDLEIGSEISAKDLDLLKSLGIDNLDQYLIEMDDGTARLVGSAERFVNVVEQSQLEKVKDIQAAQEANFNGVNSETAPYDLFTTNENRSDDFKKKQVGMLSDAGYDTTGILDTEGNIANLELLDQLLLQISTDYELSSDSAKNYASSLSELEALQNVGLLSDEEYSAKLLEIGNQYENTSEEISRYAAALANGNQQAIDATELELQLAIAAGEQAAMFDLEGAEVEEVSNLFAKLADSGDETYKTLKHVNGELDVQAVTEAAVRYQRLNAAVEDLADNCDDYIDTLKKFQKASDKNDKITISQTSSFKKMKKSLADLLNTSEEFIDLDFVDAIDPDDFQKAANGNEDAIDNIRNAFARAQMEAVGLGDMADQLVNELAGLKEGQVIDIDNSPALQALIEAQVLAGASATDIQNLLSGLSVGCDNVEFLNAMGEVVEASNEAVAAGSIDAEAQTVTVNNNDTVEDASVEETVTQSTSVANDALLETSGSGASTRPVQQRFTAFSKTVSVEPDQEQVLKQNSVTGVRLSNAHVSAGGKVATSNKSQAGNTGGSGGSGGGGGGGSSKPAKKVQKTKFTDLGDRYHTITKQIDNQARATDKLAKLEDRLYGAAKLKAMKEQSQELLKQKDLLEQKRKEAEAYLTEDTKELEDQIANWNSTYGTNLKVEYGKDGEILNYREIIEAVQGVTNAWEDKLNSYATQEEQDSDENQQYQEDLDNNTSALTDAIAQYEETHDTLNEIDDNIEDLIDEYQSMNFEAWSYSIELLTNRLDRIVSVFERTNRLLQISADNIYTAAEYAKKARGNADATMDNIKKIIGDKVYNSAMDGTLDVTKVFEEMKKDSSNEIGNLYQQYTTGKINQAQYIEGVQTLMDTLGDWGDQLMDYIEEGLESFTNALSDAQDRIGFFSDKIADASSELDHYDNLLDLVGRQNDYETKAQIYQAQGQVKTSQVNAAKDAMDLYQTQYDKAQGYYDTLTTQAEKDMFRPTLEAAYSALTESQEDYLSACEEYAEAMKRIAENELDLINKELTEAILGKDKTWDAVNDQLDRYSSVGEEYLTNTNKVYEITKLTRDIQSKIDSTSNTAAQQRLATFKKQTEELGKQEKLTEYELELQNKKYELLQAQIAMEEAQNAKSQVRLTRDSEGNYSYTYTADEDTLQSAEDKYLEKQNALYNYALEGSQDYYTKYCQTSQALYEALGELQTAWLNGEITSVEEYNRQKAEIQSYYGDQLLTYANLYNLSMEELNENATDSWTTQQGLIISTTQQTGSNLDGEASQIVYNLNGHLENMQTAFGLTQDKATGTMGALNEYIKQSITGENDSINSYFDKGKDAVDDYREAIEGNESPITDVLNNIGTSAKEAAEKATSAAEEINTLTDSLKDQLSAVMNITEGWVEFAESIELVRDTLAALQEDMNDEITSQEESDPVDVTPELPVEETPAEEGSPNGEEAMPKDNVTFDMVKEIYNKINNGNWSGTYGWDNRRQRAINEGYPPEAYEIAQYVINDTYTIPNRGNASYLGRIDEAIKHELEKAGYAFDTGGYTGEWGAEGRLALLHQKELVLNAADTQNMLSMVEIVRDLIQTLDLNTLSSTLGGINALTSGWNNFHNEAEKLEQEIHIEANFPNATDRNEIMEAFSGLADLASQYAGR